MLATGFIESTGKSTIGAPVRQMQIDRRAKHLRQIRATLPVRADRYNRQTQSINWGRKGLSPAGKSRLQPDSCALFNDSRSAALRNTTHLQAVVACRDWQTQSPCGHMHEIDPIQKWWLL
jgi:hypothetical protein